MKILNQWALADAMSGALKSRYLQSKLDAYLFDFQSGDVFGSSTIL